MPPKRICSIHDCGKPHMARGWCEKHYDRWKRHGDPNICLVPMSPAGSHPKFIETAILYDGDECLIWPFGKLQSRPTTNIRGHATSVCRIICERIYGPAPTDTHEAAHSCGKGHLGCVSPKHLRWANPAENHADKLLHGTDNRGNRHGMAKLTANEIIYIRSLKGILTQKEIANIFSISNQHVSEIISRKTWIWLD